MPNNSVSELHTLFDETFRAVAVKIRLSLEVTDSTIFEQIDEKVIHSVSGKAVRRAKLFV